LEEHRLASSIFLSCEIEEIGDGERHFAVANRHPYSGDHHSVAPVPMMAD
jgi:hypothetical protein